MAITASGLFYPSFEDMLMNDSAIDLAADSIKVALFNNTTTAPNFGTNTAYAVAPFNANEVGTPAAGIALTTPTVTLDTSAGIKLKFDAVDTAWGSQTITGIRGVLGFDDTITTPVADPAIFLVDLTADYAVTSGVFTLQWAAAGIFTLQLAA